MHGSVQYDAREFRRLIDTMFSEGVFHGLAVTQRGAGANFSVDVGLGLCVVQGDDQSLQGKYLCRSTATENVTIAAAPGSNSRYDIIVLRVNDPTAGGAAGNNTTIVSITGTASASPVAPTVPATALHLATIGPITSGTASITNAIIADARVTARSTFDIVLDNTISTSKIVDGAVTTAKLVDSSVTNAKMADNSVGTAELLDDAVTDAEMGAMAATSSGGLTIRRYGELVIAHGNAASGPPTIPSGYRPAAQIRVPANISNAVNESSYVLVNTNGTISLGAGITTVAYINASWSTV